MFETNVHCLVTYSLLNQIYSTLVQSSVLQNITINATAETKLPVNQLHMASVAD